MYRALLVGVGGFVGSVARYELAGVAQRMTSSEFPIGTLTVNVIGSFIIGVVLALSLERGLLNADLRVLLTAGFCGGFTTMSTFSYETIALLRDGSIATALMNVLGTLAICLMAVWFGDAVGRFV